MKTKVKKTDDSVKNANAQAAAIFRITEVEGRSKSTPITRQGCISFPKK